MVPHLPFVLLSFSTIDFCSRIHSLVSFSPSVCVKKTFSSSATSQEDVVTSMVVGCTSSLILRRMFFVTYNSSLEMKPAAVLTEAAICAILKLNCNTDWHAFYNDGGTAFVGKKRVTDLISVETILGFDASHKTFANSGNAMRTAKTSFEYKDTLSFAGTEKF